MLPLQGFIKPLRPLRNVRGVFYGWWLAAIAGFVMGVCIPPFFHGMTAWFVVLQRHFPLWTRGQMSWAFAVTKVEGGITGPIEGILVDRLGPRLMVLIGMIILGSGFLILSRVSELWHLYGAFIVMSIGAGLGTWLPMITALNNWFVRRRTTAMSLALGGMAVGAVLVVPALAWAIDPDADRFGWRATAIGIGVLVILLAFPVSSLVRNRPEDYGQHPDSNTEYPESMQSRQPEAQQAPVEERGVTWREAVQTRDFWLITFGHACSAIVLVTITVHLGLMLEDRGLSLQMIAWVVSTYQLVGAAFTFASGYVGDRVPIKLATFGFSALQSVAVIVLLLAHSAPVAFLFAVLLGIGFGGRFPLTTAIRGAYFGRRAFGTITGISMVPMNVLMFAAPLFAGYMFDITGSYAVPFITVAVVGFLGSCLFLLLGEPAPLAHRRQPVRTTSV